MTPLDVRKVIGSSPISSTRTRKATQAGGLFFFSADLGLEPIAVQHAGGMLLTPVQKLAATIIFAPRAKMHIESYIVHHEKTVIVMQSRSFQLYSPSASYIASQLYLACAKLYCPTGSFGGEYNITAA